MLTESLRRRVVDGRNLRIKARSWIAIAGLAGTLACGGGGGGGDTPDAASHPDAAPVADAAIDAPPVSAECQKAPNAARREQLLAAQPTIGVRSRQQLTATITWNSLADQPAMTCSVELRFKDSNGNGTLEPYEDWTRGATERAADLAGRLNVEQKLGLMAHASIADAPTSGSSGPTAATRALIETAHIRFGRTAAHNATPQLRATWANGVQEIAEATGLGIPFVLSMDPAHSSAGGRVKARGFSQWPSEAAMGATGDLALIESYGKIVAVEYRAIGVRMALSPSADLATEPRWYGAQFSFGEDSAKVGDRVAAYIKGAQGAALGPSSVACVATGFPGAGAAKGGWDGRLAKGKLLAFSDTHIDAHLAPFQKALGAGVAGVMPAYAYPEAGAWSGQSGFLDGNGLEQVGSAFNKRLVTDLLRDRFGFGGLVLAPWGILEDPGVSPLGAPWGLEAQTRAQRAAKAVNAGVDQLGGLNDTQPLAAARSAGQISEAQIDAAARRALALIFQLGLFEDPYVDPAQAPVVINTDQSIRAGRDAMNRGMVLLVNNLKPAGWLNGAGDGTQTGDKGNAGNGSLRVLPAPPGEPYVSAGCSYFIMGNFDLDYVRSVSTGYGEMTNDATSIKGIPVSTAAERIALSDYVFIRIDAPFTADPLSGGMNLPLASLEYAGGDNAAELEDLVFARNAIDSWSGTPASQTQIVVGVDAGRPSVVQEILDIGVSALYVDWDGVYPANTDADKIFLDVAFGIAAGTGKLPVGLPASNAAAAAQEEDLARDGQHATFIEGFGFDTRRFE